MLGGKSREVRESDLPVLLLFLLSSCCPSARETNDMETLAAILRELGIDERLIASSIAPNDPQALLSLLEFTAGPRHARPSRLLPYGVATRTSLRQRLAMSGGGFRRSEEHTSELQSQ